VSTSREKAHNRRVTWARMSRALLPAHDAWAGYARTAVAIAGPRGTLTVAAARAGDVGAWPWGTPDALFVLTAWDPGDERPGLHENRRRQASLEEDVRRLTDARWDAVGVDPETGRREEGVVVGQLSEAEATALGAQYGQDAVFRWTPDAWEIVACTGQRRVVLGWAALDTTT
jgi:Protein of unknown function (DUF3293)